MWIKASKQELTDQAMFETLQHTCSRTPQTIQRQNRLASVLAEMGMPY